MESLNPRNQYAEILTEQNEVLKQEDGSTSTNTFGDRFIFETDDITVIYYDQPMGEGEIYLSDDSPEIEWYYPIPDSSFYSLMDYVCKYIE